ncbi:MAG: flagellar M-ring protein FliF [Azoarcus sp.]|jgi:flagellar M-ring protein FliF|nr:flagellar M-ring protein FliF [Azoarcus sp.]
MATAENIAGNPNALDAAPENSNALRARLQQLISNARALTQPQKIAAAAMLALAIAFIAGIVLWNRDPGTAVLFADFDSHDGGEIISALQAQNVPYSMSKDGRAILVPKAMVHETRLRLAAQGLPKGGIVGFELMDNQKLGMSQFNEQVNYQRALEGELARTIQSLSSVAGARVHLAIPKQTAFLRDNEKPTASVMVQLRPGRFLDANQVAGIVHLVSSSVPKMNESGVSIIDQHGELLTRSPDDKNRSELDPAQLRYIEEVETALNRRIDNILTPIFGRDNFRAQVAVDIDFNQVEQTAETYKPNPSPDQAIRSQQTIEQQTRDQGPQGVPGALTNQPPVPAIAPITVPPVPATGPGGQPLTNSRSAVLNYELDHTIQHVKQSIGQTKRLTIAVVINHRNLQIPGGEPQTLPISDDEITRITGLVRDAVGYNPARGDTISVTSSPFAESTLKPQYPLWKDPEVLALGKESLPYIMTFIAILLAYFAIIRPLLRVLMPPPPPRTDGKAGETEREMEPGDGYDDAIVELTAEATEEDSYEKRVERARELARSNPKHVSELLKEWMGLNEEGGRK